MKIFIYFSLISLLFFFILPRTPIPKWIVTRYLSNLTDLPVTIDYMNWDWLSWSGQFDCQLKDVTIGNSSHFSHEYPFCEVEDIFISASLWNLFKGSNSITHLSITFDHFYFNLANISGKVESNLEHYQDHKFHWNFEDQLSSLESASFQVNYFSLITEEELQTFSIDIQKSFEGDDCFEYFQKSFQKILFAKKIWALFHRKEKVSIGALIQKGRYWIDSISEHFEGKPQEEKQSLKEEEESVVQI